MSLSAVRERDAQALAGALDLPVRREVSAQVRERWAAASALVHGIESWRGGVRYGDGPGEALDVYPSPRANAPVLVFIPGDGWREVDTGLHGFVAPSFTAEGALVVVPGHAPCADVGLQRVVLQVARALAWVHRHAALYGGNARRIVVAGHGSGGHLAAMMLSCRWKEIDRRLPAQLVHGALAISGVFDLARLRRAGFRADELRLTSRSVGQLSPAFFPAPSRPLLAVVGAQEDDAARRQSQLLREQWGRAAVPVCETIPFADHDTLLHGLADPRGRVHALARGLLGLKGADA